MTVSEDNRGQSRALTTPSGALLDRVDNSATFARWESRKCQILWSLQVLISYKHSDTLCVSTFQTTFAHVSTESDTYDLSQLVQYSIPTRNTKHPGGMAGGQ